MVAYYFAFCMVASTAYEEGFQLNRCYHWDRDVCEAAMGTCYEGFVARPVFRSAPAS